MPLQPVRAFDGVDDEIHCHPGGADITGAWTAAVLMKPTDEFDVVFQGHNAAGATTGYGFETDRTRRLRTYSGNGGDEPSSPHYFLPDGQWTVAAVSKAAGTVVPDMHCYDFSTGLWSRSPASGSMRDAFAMGAGGAFVIGRYAHNWRFGGQLAAIAVWDADLADATIDQLVTVPSLAAWAGVASPRALLLFDQPSIGILVQDLVGTSHEKSGASVGTSVVTADLPIPYRSVTAAVHDGSGWSDRPLHVHDGAGWTIPTSAGAL